MLASALRSRVVARLAVAALALGLFALAGLQQWSTDRTARDTARLGEINEIGAHWAMLLETLNTQDDAMKSFVQATDETGREPLATAILWGKDELTWLQDHTEPVHQDDVVLVADAYHSYIQTLGRMTEQAKRGDTQELASRAAGASLLADTLRKQMSANSARRRLETTSYLQEAQRYNHGLKVVSNWVFAVDVMLLLLCSAVLLSHQRRIERQAADSAHKALHDALTGLPNRVLLNDRLTQAVAAAGPSGEAVALLLIDLDRFKEVNDTLGHHAGDLLLQLIATRLSGAVRDVDTVVRLGGDEFAVLMPTVAASADAERLARRLLYILQQPAELDGTVVDVDGSIGVALYPTHSGDAEQLLQHADIAMYNAKRNRLGTAVYVPEGADHRVVRRPAEVIDSDFRTVSSVVAP
jgi:diguanylate cyclase (GGDEF)-like protein